MKKIRIGMFASTFILLVGTLHSQTIKRIKDPHIVGQEKRQVFQEWGDWQPEGKYFLGIQYNWNYTMVWGWAAPDRNKRYKDGDDIRPLSLTGLQNQRYATTLVQEDRTDKILKHAEVTHDETFDEYMHISSLGVQADPLYILYYKRELKPCENLVGFGGQNPFRNLGMTQETFKNNQRYGILETLKIDAEKLEAKYEMAKSVDMPRGKRILLYHECLLDLRKMKKYVDYLNRQSANRIKAQQRLAKLEQMKKNGTITRERRDAEIFMDVLLSNPIQL